MTQRGQRTSRASRTSLALAIQAIIAAALIGAAPATARASLYAVTNAGVVFESSNDGANWATKGQIPEPSVVSLSPGLIAGQLFALGMSGSLYKSSDAGATWAAVGNVGASDCVSLAIARGGDLIALTRSGDVVRTTNGGANWTTVSTVGASDGVALSVGGKAGGIDTLFAITSSGDVAISPTGSSWTNVGTTGYTPIVDLLWIAKTLYALTDAGEILKSFDNGTTWLAIAAISQVGMRDLAYVGGRFKAIAREGEVAESASGVSWSWIGTTNQVFIVAFAPGVPEFQTEVEGPGPGASRVTLRAWPNPFTERVSFRLDGADVAGDAAIELFDAAGRRVGAAVSTSAGSSSAPPRTWTWDGRLASPGVYFARVRTGTPHDTIRLVVLR